MRKLFLHLSVASITFFFSLGLMTLLDSATRIVPPALEHTVHPGVLVDADEQELREIYRQYGPAQTNHDRAFFERVESDLFILFDVDRNLTREQDIREMESWPKDTVYDCEVESIRFIGDGAVVIIRTHERSKNEDTFYRSVDVWVKEEECWKILSTTALLE